MRILLDHCVSHRLRRRFPGHTVVTAKHMGWADLRNGRLLAAVGEAGFDLLLTVDRNIKHQQNLSTLPVAVVVMLPASSKLSDLDPLVPAVESVLRTLVPRTLIEVG